MDFFVFKAPGFVAHGHPSGHLKLTKIGDPHSTLTVELNRTCSRGQVVVGLIPPSAWTSTPPAELPVLPHSRTRPLTVNIAMSDNGYGSGHVHVPS